MNKGKTILLVIIALIVLALLIWVGSSDSTMPENNTNGDEVMEQSNNATNNNSGDEAEVDVSQAEEGEGDASQANDLPPAVFNTSGEIVDSGSDWIEVNSDGSHMESGGETLVRVQISGTTNLLDANNNNISISDLNVGDDVSIEASGNIKNQTEFQASNIKLVN